MRTAGSFPSGLRMAGDRPVYMFESVLGLRCAFFFAGDEFVFFSDHTTYTVKPIKPGGHGTSTGRDSIVMAQLLNVLLDRVMHRRRNLLVLFVIAGLAAWVIWGGGPTMTPVERALVGEWGRAETDTRLFLGTTARGPLTSPWIVQEFAERPAPIDSGSSRPTTRATISSTSRGDGGSLTERFGSTTNP